MAARRPSWSRSSDASTASASRSWSMRRPATAAAARIGWAFSGTTAIRARSTSSSVADSPLRPAPSWPTASSSSAKKGFPSDRAWTRRTRRSSGTPTEDGGEELAHPGRVQADEVDPRDQPGPIQLGEPRQQGMSPAQPSERKVSSSNARCAPGAPGRGRPRSRGWPGRPSGGPRRPPTTGPPLREPMQQSEQRLEDADLQPLLLHRRLRQSLATAPARAGPGRARTARRPRPARPDRASERELARDLHDRRVREAALAHVRARAAQDEHPALLRGRRDVAHVAALADPAFPVTRRWLGWPSRAASRERVAASSSVARPMVMGLTSRRACPRS